MTKSLNFRMIFCNIFITLLLIAVIIIERQFFAFPGLPPLLLFSTAIGLVLVIINGNKLLYGIGTGSFMGLFIYNYIFTNIPAVNSLIAALLYAVSVTLYVVIIHSINSKDFVSNFSFSNPSCEFFSSS